MDEFERALSRPLTQQAREASMKRAKLLAAFNPSAEPEIIERALKTADPLTRDLLHAAGSGPLPPGE
jgi:hypothetical protein